MRRCHSEYVNPIAPLFPLRSVPLDQCTVSIKVAVCVTDPPVAVIVMLLVPEGVLWLLPEPPPHPITPAVRTTRKSSIPLIRRRGESFRDRRRPPMKSQNNPPPSTTAKTGLSESGARLRVSSAPDWTPVLIVTVLVTAALPGVTAVGEKEQVAFAGRPLHEKETD